jgi:hypothetical protein
MRSAFLPILFVTVLIVLSCSSAQNPITPLNDLQTIGGSNHELWGLYQIAINPTGINTGDAEIVPLRSAEFNANVQRFLSPPVSPVNLIRLHFSRPVSSPTDIST